MILTIQIISMFFFMAIGLPSLVQAIRGHEIPVGNFLLLAASATGFIAVTWLI